MPPDAVYEEIRKIPLKKKAETNKYSKERFEKVKGMLKDGLPMELIAKALQMSRVTISRYSKIDVLPNRNFHPSYNYNDYQKIIENGFSEGKCITAIFSEMKKAGFKGTRSGFINSLEIIQYEQILERRYYHLNTN